MFSEKQQRYMERIWKAKFFLYISKLSLLPTHKFIALPLATI
jgi:hypothetical protein